MFILNVLDIKNSNKISSYFWLALITTILYVFVYVASSFYLKVPPSFATTDTSPNIETLCITRNCSNVPQKCDSSWCDCQTLCDSKLAHRHTLSENNKFGLPQGTYCYYAPDESTTSCDLNFAYWVYVRQNNNIGGGTWKCVANDIMKNDVNGKSTEHFYPGVDDGSSTDEHGRPLVKLNSFPNFSIKNVCYDGNIDLNTGECKCTQDVSNSLLELYRGTDERCYLASNTATNLKTNKHLKLGFSPFNKSSPLPDTEHRLIFHENIATTIVDLKSAFRLS
jgi:hypothetical protein